MKRVTILDGADLIGHWRLLHEGAFIGPNQKHSLRTSGARAYAFRHGE